MSKQTTPAPPKQAEKLLLRFLREDIAEEVLGDLEEKFYVVAERKSLFRARLNYWYQVFNYLRPFAIRKTKRSTHSNYTIMFKHNLLLSFRHFIRHKSSFLINLTGLSTGLACFILIWLWVTDERSFDKFHEKSDRLYQVLQVMPDGAGVNTTEVTPGILASTLAEEMPEVEYAVSVLPAGWFHDAGTLTYQETHIKAKPQYAGKDFFNMFSYQFVAGDKDQFANEKYGIVISEDLALSLFKTTEGAIGKQVEWDKGTLGGQFVVAAVVKAPSHTSQPFDLLFNFQLFLDDRPYMKEWGNSDPHTFVLLKEGSDKDAFDHKLAGFIQSKNSESEARLIIRRFSDRYLYNHYQNGVQAGGRIEYVRMFSVIAIFILAIACINFMNLSTARVSVRLKELGVKKAIGASRKMLINQYLTESLLITFIAMIPALLFVGLFLPQFNAITGKQLVFDFNPELIALLAGVFLLTGLAAGSYPAFFLSGFRPVSVLRGRLQSSGNAYIRKGLVVFQFALSVVLIVSVLVVYKQIEFVQSTGLGYDRNNMLHFELEMKAENNAGFFDEGGVWEKRVEGMLAEVGNLPGVERAANFYHDLTGNHGGITGVSWQPGDDDEKVHFSSLETGYGFVETLGIELLKGRSFSKDFNAEKSKIVLNESAARVMGLADPVGQTIEVWGERKEVIGVVKDFHFESLYEEVKPCLLQLEPRSPNIMVKLQTGSEALAIDQLEALYKNYYPALTFDYRFLDNDYKALYEAEQTVSTLSQYFAGLAILISCLGLFGLASFTAERRQKEVAIRKTLGAGEWRILLLLSGEFALIVALATLLAIPISYFMAADWLQTFAYRIDLEPWYFVVSAVSALLVAWVTISFQTIKSARMNPVNSLRSE